MELPNNLPDNSFEKYDESLTKTRKSSPVFAHLIYLADYSQKRKR